MKPMLITLETSLSFQQDPTISLTNCYLDDFKGFEGGLLSKEIQKLLSPIAKKRNFFVFLE